MGKQYPLLQMLLGTQTVIQKYGEKKIIFGLGLRFGSLRKSTCK
jgi:hypothetical protein